MYFISKEFFVTSACVALYHVVGPFFSIAKLYASRNRPRASDTEPTSTTQIAVKAIVGVEACFAIILSCIRVHAEAARIHTIRAILDAMLNVPPYDDGL